MHKGDFMRSGLQEHEQGLAMLSGAAHNQAGSECVGSISLSPSRSESLRIGISGEAAWWWECCLIWRFNSSIWHDKLPAEHLPASFVVAGGYQQRQEKPALPLRKLARAGFARSSITPTLGRAHRGQGMCSGFCPLKDVNAA